MMIKEMASKEHKFAHAKHGTRHPWQWKQKNFKLHQVWHYIFPHEHNVIGVSLSNIWANHVSIKKDKL
jgi:hypothetical protein